MSNFIKTRVEYSYFFEIKSDVVLSPEQKNELRIFTDKFYPTEDKVLKDYNYEGIISPNISCYFAQSDFLDKNYPNFPEFLKCIRSKQEIDIENLKITPEMMLDLKAAFFQNDKEKALDFCKNLIKNHRLY